MKKFIVTFTKHHDRGPLAGMTSPDQAVTFPTLYSAKLWISEASRNNKTLSDFIIKEVQP